MGALALAPVAGAAQDPAWIEHEIAVLQGLDKITARVSTHVVWMSLRFSE